MLDATANVDADTVTNSNSTFDFAGTDAQQKELLYTKTFTCACPPCRDRSSIHLEYRGCPFMAFTGRWRQQTVHAFHHVARVAAEKREDARIFATRMVAEHLYAVFGSYPEMGGRPYWLLWCKKAPYKAPPPGPKAQDGSTINKGWWVIDAVSFEHIVLTPSPLTPASLRTNSISTWRKKLLGTS